MTIKEIRSLFREFTGREEALRAITRYSVYHTMFYRSTLWSHSQQVAWVATAIAPRASEIFGDRFDIRKSQLMALVHDDPEIIMGDVQLGNKTLMTPEQLQEVDDQEQRAIETIVERYPAFVGGYAYRDLLESYHRIDSLEAKIVKYADKFVGFGEALHEAFAGNLLFTTGLENEYGHVPTAYAIYIPYLSNFPNQYPDVAPMFGDENFPLLQKPIMIDFHHIAQTHQPHTPESITAESGYHSYDQWKRAILAFADEEEQQQLYHQREFP